MATKSIVTRALIDAASRSHDCRANKKHRIHMGDTRMKIKSGRSWIHYCTECARKIIENDIAKLQKILDEIKDPPRDPSQ